MLDIDKRFTHRPLTRFDELSHLDGELALFSNHAEDFVDLNTSKAMIGRITDKFCEIYRDTTGDSDVCSYEYCLPLRWINATIRPYKPKEFLKKFPIGSKLFIKYRHSDGFYKKKPRYSEVLVTGAYKNTVILGDYEYSLRQLFESMSYATQIINNHIYDTMFAVIEDKSIKK